MATWLYGSVLLHSKVALKWLILTYLCREHQGSSPRCCRKSLSPCKNPYYPKFGLKIAQKTRTISFQAVSHYCVRKYSYTHREPIVSVFTFIQTTVRQKIDFLVLRTLSKCFSQYIQQCSAVLTIHHSQCHELEGTHKLDH